MNYLHERQKQSQRSCFEINVMSKEDKDLFAQYWGPDEFRPFVDFSRKGLHYCIYCGKLADTREHIPPKAFLKKPLPSDLPVLPACKKCNNGFSSDELYVRAYIECLKAVFADADLNAIQPLQSDRREIRDAKESVKAALDAKKITFDKRIGRILLKLAVGHATYELSGGYHSRKWQPLYTKYIIRPTASEEAWADLEYAELLNDKVLPELGSRVFRKIYIIQPLLKSMDSDDTQKENLCFLDWTDIQDGIYRYIAYIEGSRLTVKMILMDYLYAEVVFQSDEE